MSVRVGGGGGNRGATRAPKARQPKVGGGLAKAPGGGPAARPAPTPVLVLSPMLQSLVGLEEVVSFPGDLYLLCSDGLSDMLDDESISQLLQTSDVLGEVAAALVDAANDAGGKDNISVILVRASGGASTPVRIFMENTGQVAVATVRTPGGVVTYAGDAAIDGVPGTHAPIPNAICIRITTPISRPSGMYFAISPFNSAKSMSSIMTTNRNSTAT